MSLTLSAVEKDISAENTFTDAIQVFGFFNLDVSGTWAGTITVQRKFPEDDNWRDVGSGIFESSDATVFERIGQEVELGTRYRAGFKTGEYTNGTASVRISK
jgi:hypothetical protein